MNIGFKKSENNGFLFFSLVRIDQIQIKKNKKMRILSPLLSFNISKAVQALPLSDAVTNLEIFQKFPRTASKSKAFQQKMADMITQELGFDTRYWVHKPWLSLDNAVENAETLAVNCLKTMNNLNAVDAFVMGSTTNTRYSGSQATSVLGHYGVTVPAYDFKAGCSTSLAAFSMAYGLMMLGYERVLVCCSETMSKIIDPDNEKTWLGVADGAAALIFERAENGQFCVEQSIFSTDGRYVDAFTTKGLLPPTENILLKVGYYLQGDEALLKQLAYEKYTMMLDALFENEKPDNIRWIIPHQVNRQLIDELITKYGLEHCQLIWDADKVGNIGGASIAYSLAGALKKGVFDTKGKILMMSVGGGLTFASQIVSVTG